MFKILIPEDIGEMGKRYLRDKGYTLKVGVSTDIETLKKELMEADGVIVRNASYPKAVFENSKKLKVIARHGTGVDNIDVAAAQEQGIWVTNGPTANINAVAEYTVALIMALSCRLRSLDTATRKKDWSLRLSMKRYELEGKIVGLVGFGNIGRLVAKKVSAGLGMKVIAYDLRSQEWDIPGTELTDDLEYLLSKADFVSLHIPSTEKTKGMFDHSMFQKMKENSFFINCARGDLYVEGDLIRALKEGHLAGAALDVYSQEPLKESPLLEMDQVILSQHNAGLSEESKEKMSLYAAMGVDQVLSGKIPQWPVNHPQKINGGGEV